MGARCYGGLVRRLGGGLPAETLLLCSVCKVLAMDDILRVMRYMKSYLSCWMFIVAFLAFVVTAASSLAQSPGASMPSQPAALMDMVAQRNALEVPSLKPWRLVIRVHSIDKPGEGKSGSNAAGTGDTTANRSGDAGGKEIRIEETWVSLHRYKISYQIQDHAWQVYGADTGQMIVGEAARPDFWSQALREFVGPIANNKTRANWTLQVKDQTLGKAKLKCLSVTGYMVNGEIRPGPGMTYCIDADKPNLRIVTEPFSQSRLVRNDVRIFEAQYVPGQVEMVRLGAVEWKAELESLEVMPDVDEAALMAPPEAKPLVRRISVSAEVAKGQLIKQVRPNYPIAPKEMGTSGTVVLDVTIRRDGKVADLHVLSGPAQLRQAALDAVKQWEYRPLLLNGEPVEVDTTINIVFNLATYKVFR
jgi:TonB family protein